MKKLTLFLLIAFSTFGTFAQTPQGINYQAVARNASGNVLPNINVDVRITLHEGSASNPVYREKHTVTTNQFGLFTLKIGMPSTVLTGNFSTINWGSATHFIQVEIDPNITGSFIDMGTTQFMSVPYALYAEKAGNAVNGTNGLNCWDLNGNGIGEPGEDINGDSFFNALDCKGAAGTTGTNGTNGSNGIACWDLNGNGTGEPGEDINGDSFFNALDCKGAAGTAGTNGIACWDLNGNGIGEPGEDINGDSFFNALDCKGAAGTAGTNGIACWDLNSNGTGEPGEDINGDSFFDALDCKGVPGAAGKDGAPGASGANGISCWDLNSNGIGDAGEDKNGDTFFDALDCKGDSGAQGPQGPSGSLPNGSVIGNTTFWDGTQWVVNNSNIFNNGANVGIGTTSPTAKMEAYSNAAIPQNIGVKGRVSGASNQNFGLYGDATGGNFTVGTFGNASGGNYAYGIYGSASGASTENWAGYFTSGNVNIQGGLAFGTTPSFGTAGQVLTSSGAGLAPSWTTPTGGISGSGTLNFLPKFTPNGTTVGNSLVFDDGAKVGIGNTSPLSMLHIQATAVAATAESISRFNVSDEPTSFIEIRNQTTTNGLFEPMIFARQQGSTLPSLTITADNNNDVGIQPVIVLNSTFNSGALVNRPLFAVRNNGVSKFVVDPLGNVNVPGVLNTTGFTMVPGATAGYVLTTNAAGNGTWQALPASGITGGGTNNYAARWTSGSNLATSAIWDNGTNIGLGVAPAIYKVHVIENSTNPALFVRQDGTGPAVQGNNYSTGVGVQGMASNGGYGVYARNTGTGTGLYAEATSGYAGLFIGGNVGIGTVTPTTNLQISDLSNNITTSMVTGSTKTSTLAFGSNSNNYLGVIRYDNNTNSMDFWTGNTSRMILDGSGNLGLGANPSGSYKLEVNGKVKSTGINETSDVRWKKDITTIQSALTKTMSLRGVEYNWRADEFKNKGFDTTAQIGLIAQEVEKILPQLVDTDKDGFKSVEYSKVVAVLIEAIKEQQKIIDNLKTDLGELKRENTQIKADVSSIKALLEILKQGLPQDQSTQR